MDGGCVMKDIVWMEDSRTPSSLYPPPTPHHCRHLWARPWVSPSHCHALCIYVVVTSACVCVCVCVCVVMKGLTLQCVMHHSSRLHSEHWTHWTAEHWTLLGHTGLRRIFSLRCVGRNIVMSVLRRKTAGNKEMERCVCVCVCVCVGVDENRLYLRLAQTCNPLNECFWKIRRFLFIGSFKLLTLVFETMDRLQFGPKRRHKSR